MPIDPKRVLFDDPHLLAVMKLGGELVVAGKGRMDRLPLLNFLRKQYPGIHPVHRLDFETSGVVLFAKSRAVLHTIVESGFRGWQKHYLALVLGHPSSKEGLIERRLRPRSGEGTVEAKTHYVVKERLADAALLECVIERGQRHQIRRHLSMIGHPLLLDDVYGNPKANRVFGRYLRMHRFFLHASFIDFPHPITGAPMHLACEVPANFSAALSKLRAARKG